MSSKEGRGAVEGLGAGEGVELRRKPTINDVARIAQVSKKTVSRVINRSPFVKSETRDKINEVIEQLGFSPDPQARGLAFRRSFLIGHIYDNPNPSYIVNVQQGILDALYDSSFELVVRPADRRSPTFLSDMRAFVERQKLFGVIAMPSMSEDDDLFALMRELDCPYVRVAAVKLDEPGRMILVQDHEGAAEAARYVAELGHERVAFISGPPTFRSSEVRGGGFAAGLKSQGLTLDPRYVRQGAYTFESGLECGESLLSMKERPTAIFCGNDEMAAGVYRAAHAAGLEIPTDLTVIGFDDSPLTQRLWPPLSSVRLPLRDMGRMAAERLLNPEAQESEDDSDPLTVLHPTLIHRESSAPPVGVTPKKRTTQPA
jgi:LacI family transcriptional regulator